MSAFFLAWVAVAVVASLDSIDAVDGSDRTAATRAVVAAWVAGVLFAVGLNALEWRAGRLLLTDPADRAANRGRIDRSRALWSLPVLAAAMALAAVSPTAVGVIAGLLGGFVLGLAPLLLWIAFALRPDEHRDERLEAPDWMKGPRRRR